MKKLLLGLTLVGLGFACQSSTSGVTETSEASDSATPSCCASEGSDAECSAECSAEAKAECAAAKADGEGKTCPFSGQPITEETEAVVEE